MTQQLAEGEKGYTGLANLGNTCFLNSCIQVLNHTHEFTEIFKKFDQYASRHAFTYEDTSSPANIQTPTRVPRAGVFALQDTNIIQEFRELRDLMFSNNGVVSPNRFVHMVHDLARQKGREIFTGWAQNDLSEFLLFMVECMHNCIARKAQTAISGESKHSLDELAIACYTMLQKIYATEYSEIMDLFYGISVSEIWDIRRTHRHSVKPESYFMVDLPIPGNTQTTSPTTLYDCFNEFTKREELTGENAWWNEKTNQKEDIAKNMTFWNFPKILVITLKRFSPDGQHKNNELVDFPLDNLVLSPYVSGYNPSSYVYELYGVCNHIGSVHGGHYTAFVKRAANPVRTPERGMSEEGRPEHVGEWVHFNDSVVSILPNPEGVITPMAYCLFYRKKNTGV